MPQHPYPVSISAQTTLNGIPSFPRRSPVLRPHFLFSASSSPPCGACGHQILPGCLLPTALGPTGPQSQSGAHPGPSLPPELAFCPTHCLKPSSSRLTSTRWYRGRGSGERQRRVEIQEKERKMQYIKSVAPFEGNIIAVAGMTDSGLPWSQSPGWSERGDWWVFMGSPA